MLVLVAAVAQVRPVGSVQSVDLAARKLQLKTDSGADIEVQFEEATEVVQVAPGAKDLTGATPLRVSDLTAGDRLLVRGTMAGDQKSIPARQIIVMTKAAINSKQTAERADWDRRGVFGTVASVDPANQKIVVNVRSGLGPAKPVEITASAKTIVRRYAPDSVKFADAQVSRLDEIRVGDQVRARGEKSADGASLAAEEMVSGTFRNVAAQIVSIDAAAKVMTVTDLDTKKPLVVRLSPDSSMRKLPDMMAQFLAMRLNAGETGPPGAAGGAGTAGAGNAMRPGAPGAPPAGSGAMAAGRPPGSGGPGGMAGPGAMGFPGGMGGGMGRGPGGPGGPGGPPNPAQMLERMPAIQLADLKAGDALIIASTAGRDDKSVTAITVLAGVEPILATPSRNRQTFLGMWNLDMGGGMGMGMQ